MSLSAKLRRAPQRLASGAYVLNSGVSKLNADEDTAKALHGMAAGTYPVLAKVQPKVFVKGLAIGEIAVGSAVLLPIVPPVVAGAALVGFSGAILNMYWRTPGMHEPGDPRPTAQGQVFAKDVWLFGIGTSLIADALLEPAHDKKVEIEATVLEKRAQKSRRSRRKAKKQTAKANAQLAKQARELQSEAAKRAKKAQKQAEKAAEKAAKRLAEARAEYGPVAAEKAKQVGEAVREFAEEYGPVAAEKAKQAREAAREWADEYGPVAAEKAKQAREAAREWADEYGSVAAEKAKQAREAAREWAEEYGTVAAEKTKQARAAAMAAGSKARERVAS
jgi:uncharacterized membrane protein YphA (DoxX/SURF4 family)